MRLDLADLRLFLSIVDAGSITGGAAASNLALGSASERLRSIEADAGVTLLERRHRGIVPTEAGEAVAHHARLMLQQQARLRDEMRDFVGGRRGTLHLHANTAALVEFLPQRLAPWLAERPRLRLELRERTSTEIVRAVSAGLVEAGIVSDAVDAGALHRQRLARADLVLIVPPDHALAASRRVHFGAALREPFVGLGAGSALQDYVVEQASRAGSDLQMRTRMPTFEGVCELVSHGVGIAVLPASVAGRMRRRHRYRTVSLADSWALRHLCACYSTWSKLSPPMRNLLVHLGASLT